MRDILVTLLVFGSLPFILMRPYVGVLVWSWLSYMNPHRLTWGFAYDMPFAQIVAVTLLISVFINKDKKGIPLNATTTIWILFVGWMLITTLNAVYFDRAFDYFIRVAKIQLITFLTLMLITTKDRLNYLIWTIVLSIGFFTLKGGLFTILTGGAHRVYGPEDSMISENNAMGLTTLMVIPLMYYLWTVTSHKWVKRFLLLAIVLSVAAALGSQSRGALVATIAVGGYFWWQSKSKVITGIALVLLLGIGVMFMPESWHERMDSIRNYEEDESAMSRIHAWTYSLNIASDRITGGGFNSWSRPTYAVYSPEGKGTYVAHSIYFNVLADHGWLGLILFLLIWGWTWMNLSKVARITRNDALYRDFHVLSRMIKVSLVAYFSGGAFLSLSYFDLPWHLFAIAVIVVSLVEPRELARQARHKPVGSGLEKSGSYR
ncbi:MAG: putative O-glycosylation ligase, exosortase A system-associated [Porticoccaceae bacterium]|nr:putative O-glycosylation ligase, exosortase A system-associated [Porticoccaceae bacterium]